MPAVRAGTCAALLAGTWVARVEAQEAQETRAAILEKLKAEKSLRAEPFKPGRLERFFAWTDRTDLFERWTKGDGFFPRIGGITTGGGYSVGGGYRRHFLDYLGVAEISAAGSFKGYRLYRLEVGFPELLDTHLDLGTDFTYRSYPQEDFYGLGPRTREDDRVNFLVEGSDIAGQATIRPRSWLATGTRVGYLNANLGRGTDTALPSIEDEFTAKTAPGLAQQPNYLYGEIFADVDTRDEPGNPRSGTHHRLAWIRYDDRNLDHFTFSRFNAELSHFFSIFDKKRVLLMRGRLTLSEADSGNEVPFFLLPPLGGSRTLRSQPDFRFRDNHRLLFNVEYRWEAFSGVDLGLFADAGKVASRREDVKLTGLREAYGVGIRFTSTSRILCRVDIAHGRDGFHYYFKLSGPFRDREQWPIDNQSHRH